MIEELEWQTRRDRINNKLWSHPRVKTRGDGIAFFKGANIATIFRSWKI